MSDQSDGKTPRKPVVVTVREETPRQPATAHIRMPAHFDHVAAEDNVEDDPLLWDTALEDDLLSGRNVGPARRFPFFKIALGAAGFLLSLAFGLWIDGLINDLFNRADWLGYTAIAALVITILAGLAFIARELSGLASLTNIQKLKQSARNAALSRNPDDARQVARHLSDHLSHSPETAKGRAELSRHAEDIIDNTGLMSLAETELLTPLDTEARRLIAGAARRVSVVTAVSPRALVDLGYVLFEAAKLVRALAFLYGGRPGFFGFFRLMRETLAHLAVTGTIALGDDMLQQVLGHGLASKVSAKLGEGVANGLMTARIGIAAMDLCRPMDFRETRRPKVTDFLNVLSQGLRRPA